MKSPETRSVAVGGAQRGVTLTTIDTARWRVLRSVRVDPFAVPSIDATTRRIFVASASAGSIALLDATTGRPVRPVRTLPGPVISTPFPTYPIVVDARSGHALLMNLDTGVSDVLIGVALARP